jgi:hypothetical protein
MQWRKLCNLALQYTISAGPYTKTCRVPAPVATNASQREEGVSVKSPDEGYGDCTPCQGQTYSHRNPE